MQAIIYKTCGTKLLNLLFFGNDRQFNIRHNYQFSDNVIQAFNTEFGLRYLSHALLKLLNGQNTGSSSSGCSVVGRSLTESFDGSIGTDCVTEWGT